MGRRKQSVIILIGKGLPSLVGPGVYQAPLVGDLSIFSTRKEERPSSLGRSVLGLLSMHGKESKGLGHQSYVISSPK